MIIMVGHKEIDFPKGEVERQVEARRGAYPVGKGGGARAGYGGDSGCRDVDLADAVVLGVRNE